MTDNDSDQTEPHILFHFLHTEWMKVSGRRFFIFLHIQVVRLPT